MKAIDFSRSLSYLSDDIIAEAIASKSAKTARRKPQLARCAAIAATCAAVILVAVLIGTRAGRNMPVLPPDSGDVTVPQDITSSVSQPTTPPPAVTSEPPVTTVDDTSQSTTVTEPEISDDTPSIGGGDYTFVRRYVEEAENIYIAAQIVGQEARNDWVDNVYLTMTPEEQSELPELYRIIHDLNIPKEDFIEENEKYAEYPGTYYSEEVIEALYLDDIDEMKKRLVNPTALYYDGEIYTFDGLCKTPELADNIPDDILEEYLDFIYDTAVQIGEIKYMQEDIDMLREYIN